MSKSPMDELLGRVNWKPALTEPQRPDSDLPYATHSGELQIGHMQLRCYRLNTGVEIIDASDMKRFMGFIAGDGLTTEGERR